MPIDAKGERYVYDNLDRQIRVGDEVILRGTVYFEEGDAGVIELRTPSGGLHYVRPSSLEKVSHAEPFTTSDLPVKAEEMRAALAKAKGKATKNV